MGNDVTFTRGSESSNLLAKGSLAMLGLVPLAVAASGSPAHAQVTVPFGNITPCNAATVAANKAAGTIGAIPGQPGEMGFQTGQTVTDVNGATIAVYCLLMNAKHGGPDQAALFTPAPTRLNPAPQSVWVGGCTSGFPTPGLRTASNTTRFTSGRHSGRVDSSVPQC